MIESCPRPKKGCDSTKRKVKHGKCHPSLATSVPFWIGFDFVGLMNASFHKFGFGSRTGHLNRGTSLCEIPNESIYCELDEHTSEQANWVLHGRNQVMQVRGELTQALQKVVWGMDVKPIGLNIVKWIVRTVSMYDE